MPVVRINKLPEVTKDRLLALEQEIHDRELSRSVILHFIYHQMADNPVLL
ncbi:hypothetical protein SDC9_77510 [bioreactor metagenome]|uniref:Uncharacterized protein n=1 Tax=bioreactor metagenome TaxID=1076179 RepID=A0A644YRM9_9ZZZZ